MRRMRGWKARLVLVGAGGVLWSCDPPPLVGRGGECNSLSDCRPGLVCLEDKCTDDLEGIAGEVPVFATADAGVDGG